MNHDLSIFFSIESLIVFILVATRISGMITTAPLFSTFPIPMQLKACLAMLTAFLIYPFVLQHTDLPIPHNMLSMSLMVFKELCIGVLIGFCAQLIFVGIQIGGQLLSIQMGLAIAEALDPVTKQHVPVVGQFYLFMASLVFIFINGHNWLFTSIYSSYLTIPLGLSFDFSTDLTQKVLIFTSQLFSIAFGIIMPIFIFLFVIDIALAFLSKIMPQMNIFMVSLPLKILLGIALMCIFLPSTSIYLSSLITSLLESLKGIFS